jgi:membrane protease subunit HflK
MKAKVPQGGLEVRMAWNNNSGGPWGGGGGGGGNSGGPWGGGGGGNRGGGGGGPFGNRRPPDMEDVIRKGQERLRNLMPGGLGSFKGILLIVLAAIVIWLLTGFFRVQPNQQAIQLVFGKPYGKPVEPGLHYNLPNPIGAVVVVNVGDQRRTVIGSGTGTERTPYGRGPRPTSSENLMLTGDENIVDIEFAVLWQVKDVYKFAFAVRNVEENVRQAAEAAMREVIGKSNLQYAQTEGRTRIEQDTKDLLQRILDDYGMGARIAQVQLLRVDPPQEVIGAFRDVQAARADKEKNINEANTYRNQVLPRAKGEAETIIQRAEGYKAQKVASAKGDVQRFTQVYDQYTKAKDITSERLYIEAIEEVLRSVNKVLIDKNGGPGVLPYLPLPELRSGQSPGQPQPPRPGPAPTTGGTR